jgi:pimeloyl-ACP methyl ester carboxylesterase
MPTTHLTTKKISHNGATLTVYEAGGTATGTQFIWAHGWGRNHADFLPFVEKLKHLGEHYLLDFPGFGASAEPDHPLTVAGYATLTETWLKTLPKGEKIWVCHSFGGRVGLHIAAKTPALINKLVLIAAHGIKPIRALHTQLYIWAKIRLFKAAKALIKLGLINETIKNRFGAADYQAASPTFRQTFVKVVQDDVTPLLPQISQPALLVYAAEDTSTPPALGQKMATLLPNSSFEVLDGFNHFTILTTGQHQVLHLILNWLKTK